MPEPPAEAGRERRERQLTEGEAWCRRYGRREPPPAPRTVSAGPLEAGWLGPDIVDLTADGTVLAGRVGVRVRDVRWGTAATRVAESSLDAGRGAFTASARSRSADEQIEFEWSSAVTGEADGVVGYEMSGRACRDFEFARIGICVLLPAEVYAGRPFAAGGTCDGRVASNGRLPLLVAPPVRRGDVELPLFPGFNELEVQLTERLTVWMSFEGDIFELEDQRNWADGSFKIYSSSVSDRLPRRLRAGQRVHQRLRVGIRASPAHRPQRRRGSAVTVSLGRPGPTRVPRIGAELNRDSSVPSPAALGRLRGLRLAHLRVELSPGAPTSSSALNRGLSFARALGTVLELVVIGERHDERELARLLGCVPPDAATRIIAVPPPPGVTTPAQIDSIRRALRGRLQQTPVAGGTDSDFAELNADRPPLDGFDGLAFSMNPQVHETDERALVEALVGQEAAALTAASFGGGLSIHVSPVTLMPRISAGPDVPRHTPPDRRQATSFLAGWTVGSIRRLAVAGVSSITYFELTGSAGLARHGEQTERAVGHAPDPHVVLRVLGRACTWRELPLLDVEISDTSAIETLAVETNGGTSALIANLQPRRVRVSVSGESLGEAWFEPLAPSPAAAVRLSGASLELSMEPFGVAAVYTGAAVPSPSQLSP